MAMLLWVQPWPQHSQYTVLVVAIVFVLLGPPVDCVDMVVRVSASSIHWLATQGCCGHLVSKHVRATVVARSPSPLGQQFFARNVSFSIWSRATLLTTVVMPACRKYICRLRAPPKSLIVIKAGFK